ncbi:LLM class flavin-dependent oxidoreductase [Ktedonobacter racemifer]|uniref:Luciferase-like, subgroup n=1 Tax=Ktedonobacter racemifer DSM 44963 TaxID=485913 RepID=D6TS83_KTERA|nr:LLM class flavin-dependent oxidoreductase [Ktedonobacter racemifer]EFH83284.1 Luciferase-like, subgroup [Ktedonobacter racemifer DSM 44963]
MHIPTVSQTHPDSKSRALRERLGLLTYQTPPAEALATIVAAEAASVHQVWRTQGTPLWNSLTVLAAAATHTTTICLGTAIMPTYAHHPVALAQQALALASFAPNRLRLGIGPGNRQPIESSYGLTPSRPLAHLREYLTILRAALWTGHVEHHGSFYHTQATLPESAQVPILISALREKAFALAGELADGAIAWVCPPKYLLHTALPTMRASAERAGRPTPPLIAQVFVVLDSDPQSVRSAFRAQFDHGRFYGNQPEYAAMFTAAGFPVSPDGSWSDDLIDTLVISGNEATIASRLAELLSFGLDELLIMPLQSSDPTNLPRLTHLIGRL